MTQDQPELDVRFQAVPVPQAHWEMLQRTGFFSDEILDRADAMAGWTAHRRNWKYASRDLTPYTEWYPNAKEVLLPEKLMQRLNEEATKRHEAKGRSDGKQNYGSGLKIDMMGVRGEAAWALYLGIDVEEVFKYSFKKRWQGDLPVPGTSHRIEVKTAMIRRADSHLALQPTKKAPVAAAYALTMPVERYPKDVTTVSNLLLVGWQSKRWFEILGQSRTLKKDPVFCLQADQLQPPARLKEKMKAYL